MKNYKEQTISGTSWARAFHVDCRNPIDDAKTITATATLRSWHRKH